MTPEQSAEHRAYVFAEVEHLLGTDTAESIAHRLGYGSPRNLDRYLTKWGRHDLARHFRPTAVYA